MLPSLIRNLRSAGRQRLREPLMLSIATASLAAAMRAGTYRFGFVNRSSVASLRKLTGGTGGTR